MEKNTLMLKGWSKILRNSISNSKGIRKLVDVYCGISDGHQTKFAKMLVQLYRSKMLDILWH